QYEKIGENKYKIANQKNIDNGTGLERLLAVMNNLDDNYQTDLFWPIIKEIEELSNSKYGEDEETNKQMRIIADHLRAATFIMGDDMGIAPSNVDQGYVVRKLIRRAIRHGRMIGIKENFSHKIAEVVIEIMNEIYPELLRNKKFILDNLMAEEDKFTRTLQEGMKMFHENIKTLKHKNNISGSLAFNLFQTYGFPLELTKELAKENGLEVDEAEFNEEFKKHQELSRTAAAGKFKGGLADHSEKVTQYHTATHLLLAALRKILSEDIAQKGSNITDERMRFDFNWLEKVPEDKLKEVEDLVNQKIIEKIPVEMQELPKEEAIKIVKKLSFDLSKYGDIVKVYLIGDFSAEFCGGPHVKNTSELGHFRIIKEEASSAGVRRIKAVLE
ncbi:alanine--tRNA ligase, partial [Candidatus Kuenenbacteria bacterium CG23_combo_of_CG06-09_8_20_14_all_36_9]